MNLQEPLTLTQGDMDGTPIALVEGRRRQGRVVLFDRPPGPDMIDYELVWGETACRQTGYHRAAMLKTGSVALYERLTARDLEALGGPLPQDPSGESNHDKALRQRAERDITKGLADAAEGRPALEHVRAALK